MIYHSFRELENAVSAKRKNTVVVAAAHDSHALEAVLTANREGLADYLLTGNADEITRIGNELGYALDRSRIISCGDDVSSASAAVKLVKDGQGDFLMKGKLETATLLRAVLDKENGIRTDSTMSHVAILESPKYHKLFAVTDGGMIPYPTLEQKRLILKNAVDLFHLLGYEQPKAAVLAASESVNDKMPETADGAALKEMAGKGEFGSCAVEGPVSFDLAVSRESAEIKGYNSAVTADFDILMVPNISAGNLLSKSLIYMGGAIMAGCIVGAKAPIVLTSRGATAEEKRLSILLCASISS